MEYGSHLPSNRTFHSKQRRNVATPNITVIHSTLTPTSRMEEQPVIIVSNNSSAQGEHQQHKGFKPPPTGLANQLNKEMADAAAKKYNKNKKNIRKACADLEDDGANQGKCAGCRVM